LRISRCNEVWGIVRCDTNKQFGSVNLIVHYGIAKISHQTVEFPCILGDTKILSGYN
jgi:diphthamide synthase subunit DPH2